MPFDYIKYIQTRHVSRKICYERKSVVETLTHIEEVVFQKAFVPVQDQDATRKDAFAMNIDSFIKNLHALGTTSFFGVPDSQLKPLCDALIDRFGISEHHIVAANEGNAVALAAGHHLATGKRACVYLQNSGLGNIVNPVASLLNDKVYSIPCVFVVGWRGEPGVHDEPQHAFQGEITLKILELLGIDYTILDGASDERTIGESLDRFKYLLESGKSVAFVVKKGALTYSRKEAPTPSDRMMREDILRMIVEAARGDVLVSTTGKTSRELFEIREQNTQSHKHDFLTVGSMGHSSSIALGIALARPEKRVWCLDGDGAALMHMGAMAVIGSRSPRNLIHVIINNEAHESVGGQPTATSAVSLVRLASACGYAHALRAENSEELRETLSCIDERQGPLFLEVKAAVGSRDDLGRPTTTPLQNKTAVMEFLKECD